MLNQIEIMFRLFTLMSSVDTMKVDCVCMNANVCIVHDNKLIFLSAS